MLPALLLLSTPAYRHYTVQFPVYSLTASCGLEDETELYWQDLSRVIGTDRVHLSWRSFSSADGGCYAPALLDQAGRRGGTLAAEVVVSYESRCARAESCAPNDALGEDCEDLGYFVTTTTEHVSLRFLEGVHTERWFGNGGAVVASEKVSACPLPRGAAAL